MRLFLSLSLLLTFTSSAQATSLFQLPTANRNLFIPGKGDQFYVGTVGKPWPSGAYGCRRTYGRQMHEGLDIRALLRDKRNNPLDPILAAAPGSVAYINKYAGLSSYGRYIVLKHEIEGLEIVTLYAHLSEIADGLQVGQSIKMGQQIAIMGTTANTSQRISKARAHLHFEIGVVINHDYVGWHKRKYRVKKVEHGKWNGRNLLGMDPARIFLAQDQQGEDFRLLQAILHETVLCRVTIPKADLQWARRYPDLILPNPIADHEGIAGYELSLNYHGIPFQITPRAKSELVDTRNPKLLFVNEEEHKRNHCRRIVEKKGASWRLGSAGQQLLNLLAY